MRRREEGHESDKRTADAVNPMRAQKNREEGIGRCCVLACSNKIQDCFLAIFFSWAKSGPKAALFPDLGLRREAHAHQARVMGMLAQSLG